MNDQYRLQLPSEDQAKIDRERMEREALRNRIYWQKWKQEHERVYGTVPKAVYAHIKSIADANDRPVWTQIWLESCAYRKAEFLPTAQIMARQDRMVAELRRIGNNLNQLAAQGHVHHLPQGAQDVTSQMLALEQTVLEFTRQPWLKPVGSSK